VKPQVTSPLRLVAAGRDSAANGLENRCGQPAPGGFSQPPAGERERTHLLPQFDATPKANASALIENRDNLVGPSRGKSEAQD
jgi:hypothetical protein